MDHNSASVINEVIAKLQGLLSGNTGSSASLETSIPQFQIPFSKCQQKAKTLNPQIITLTNIYEKAIKEMKLIIGYSKICKKFNPNSQEKLKQKFYALSRQTEQLQRKNVQYIDHCKTIRQLLSTTFWVFVDTPQFVFKGSIQGADFNAMKFQKKKNLDHNQWYRLFGMAVRGLQKFVLQNYRNGLLFNFKGQDKWEQIVSGNVSSQKIQPKVQIQVKEQPKAPVKKAKKKQMFGLNMNINNYEDENIDVKNGQLQMKHSIFLQNSKNVRLSVDPKIKSLMINKCQGLTIIIRSCVSGVQIINSKNIKLIVKERTPSISIDQTKGVNIILNQQNLQCDVLSTKASQVTVAYQKQDGNESKAFTVASQLLTKWNAKTNKFQTSVYDKFL